MVLDKSKLEFSSSWEIDNTLDPIPDRAISANVNTSMYTLKDPNWWNMFHIQFSPDGTYWFNIGEFDWQGTIHGCHAWYESGQIIFVSDIAGTARMWVWGDKVNY